MATYKVLQDIEAEDHILGPLSLRQFIYGLISAFCLYICFICLTKGAAFLLVLFLPPALFTGFFAFPFGKDQPTEVWALAKLRFLFKPRRRIWNQSGVKELVTITVPKKLEVQRTNGLSQTEVKSRLQALADTIDSRGWAIKNVAASAYTRPGLLNPDEDSERLLTITSMPQPVPDFEIPDSEDMLNEQASPLAQQFGTMIKTSTQAHRQKLMEQLGQVRAATTALVPDPPQWFSRSPTAGPRPVTAPAAEPISESALSAQLQQRAAAEAQANAHLQTLQPTPPSGSAAASLQLSATPVTKPLASPPPTVTAPTDPAILNLAKNNDLNVATLAREAGKTKDLSGAGDEVVIALR